MSMCNQGLSLYDRGCSREKNTGPAQLQCLHSEVGEHGNEATTNVVKLMYMGHLEVWHIFALVQ